MRAWFLFFMSVVKSLKSVFGGILFDGGESDVSGVEVVRRMRLGCNLGQIDPRYLSLTDSEYGDPMSILMVLAKVVGKISQIIDFKVDIKRFDKNYPMLVGWRSENDPITNFDEIPDDKIVAKGTVIRPNGVNDFIVYVPKNDGIVPVFGNNVFMPNYRNFDQFRFEDGLNYAGYLNFHILSGLLCNAVQNKVEGSQRIVVNHFSSLNVSHLFAKGRYTLAVNQPVDKECVSGAYGYTLKKYFGTDVPVQISAGNFGVTNY
jgi:hypothetical protein